jgi:hypothetical protein
MADERDLKLNSLDRYRKQSPRLVLEEHSHCEVPAGCGGVVLRWNNPDRALPVRFRWLKPKGSELWIDGAVPDSSSPLLARGNHVLALKIKATRGQSLFVLTAAYDESDFGRQVSRKLGFTWRMASKADGTWLATTAAPTGDLWKDDPFDDSTWQPLVEVPWALDEKKSGAWELKEMTSNGAAGLGLPGAGGMVWVRKRFRIPLMSETETRGEKP